MSKKYSNKIFLKGKMAPYTRSKALPQKVVVDRYMAEQRKQREEAAKMQSAAKALLEMANKEKREAEKNLKAAKAARAKILRKEREERERALPVRQTRSMAKRR